MATMLSTLLNTGGGPLFTAVFDREPPRIDRSQFPAAVVMIPESENVRTAMRQKHDRFGCQLRIAYGIPSVGWPSAPTGAGGNIYAAPATEPQVIFDALLDQLIDGLMANQEFTQDVPGGNRQVIQLGQKITTKATEPEKRGESLLLGAIVQFEVSEQILGV